MRRRRKGHESHFRAGLVALGLVAVLLFVGFNKGIPVSSHYEVEAVFSDARHLLVGSSIRPGSPVRVAGVNVGAIAGVEKGPGGTAIVRLRIDDAGRPVHRDATASIKPRLFLEGNFFVDLKPGSPGAPEMDDGDTIPLSQTSQPVQLFEVLNTLEASTREDLQGLVREFARALDEGGAEAINRSYRYAPGAFRNAAVAAQATLGTEPHDLSQLVAASAKVSRALASRDQELGSLVEQFDRTSTTLASRREELASGLQGLDALLRESPDRLRAVDSATGPLTEFANELRPPLRQAPPVLDLAVPFLQEADRLVSPDMLPALTRDLGPTVRSLAALEGPLVELFDLVTPVVGCVRDNALPVLNSTVDDGALSSGQKVWEEILHTAAGLASSSQNFDGNGFWTRFSFGLSQDVVAAGAGEQQLFALGEYQGSRPTKPAQRPPFNPRAPCEDQPLPDLTAPAHQATTRTVGTLSQAQIRTLAEKVFHAQETTP
jgi:phospholipid/cholesterol/gamma-HCH transport system substrate-binding protein